MKTQSGKAKGRKLQQLVRDKLLELLGLEDDDVKSTPMGSKGEDIQLSPEARRLLPINVECKSRNNIAVYSWYQQAKDESKKNNTEPVLVIKADRKEPLVVIDLDYYLKLESLTKCT